MEQCTAASHSFNSIQSFGFHSLFPTICIFLLLNLTWYQSVSKHDVHQSWFSMEFRRCREDLTRIKIRTLLLAPATIQAGVFDPNDLTNPLHIHPNESPTLQLVTMQLEGRSNYHSWARAMEMALRSKNKMNFVNGLVAVPANTDPKFYYWDRCNMMVLSWILRSVSSTIARSVLWINTAESVRKDLKKRFSQRVVFRIAEIQSQIYQTKQGNSSINEYFTQLKLLWDELLLLRPIPSCECSPTCECGDKLSEKVKTHLENDILSAFLTGLNDSYTATK